ncbi:hypothetical protein COTS27_01662 [Spirochaetota bacterium]|nr:hypothetical protein COTS27_01662 [Spirochaetota bacterium]
MKEGFAVMTPLDPTKYYLDNREALSKITFYLMVGGAVLLLLAFGGAYFGGAGTNGGHGSGALPGAEIEGAVFKAAATVIEVSSRHKFFHTYLFSYVFYMAIAIGSLFFVVLQHLTRSEWSVTVRRVPEAVLGTFPLLIVLALPILTLGMGLLYHWTHPEAVAEDPILQGKSGYLNLGFFFIRSAVYFIVFYGLARVYYKNSTAQDVHGNVAHTARMQKYSPVATLVFALATTFFAFDYLMSLMPHWYSTIWGVYYFAEAVVLALSFMTLVFLVLRMKGYLEREVNIEHYHDLGKLIFAFNVFWSYIAFSQYMLIWYANIPEGTTFFVNRINGSWLEVSVLLIVGHTVLPLLLYISRNAKRNLKMQFFITILLIVMAIIDFYWVVMPNVDYGGVHVEMVDVLVFLGMGALFMGVFIRNLAKHPLIPVKDPRLERALNFENV